ncbi:MAG: hypothetical protein JWP63_5145 [Candidatus Solibacter sp.]|nr:hypothetical protein [Candidatus Solibacter sp.]
MEKEKIEIEKVQIADVSEIGEELTEAEQEKVTGGGTYGFGNDDGN